MKMPAWWKNWHGYQAGLGVAALANAALTGFNLALGNPKLACVGSFAVGACVSLMRANIGFFRMAELNTSINELNGELLAHIEAMRGVQADEIGAAIGEHLAAAIGGKPPPVTKH